MDIEFKLSTDSVESAGPVCPLCVEPQQTLGEVFALLRCKRTTSVLICEEGILRGIFTERDALRLMYRGFDPDQPISEAMVADPVTIRPDASLGTAILRMSSGGYRRLPLVDSDGRVVGLLQVSGVLHYIVEQIPKTIYNLPPVTHPAMAEREGA